MANDKLNASGCYDPTAYKAVKEVSAEERALNIRVHRLIKILKEIVDIAGFELLFRIEVRDKETRKEFR